MYHDLKKKNNASTKCFAFMGGSTLQCCWDTRLIAEGKNNVNLSPYQTVASLVLNKCWRYRSLAAAALMLAEGFACWRWWKIPIISLPNDLFRAAPFWWRTSTIIQQKIKERTISKELVWNLGKWYICYTQCVPCGLHISFLILGVLWKGRTLMTLYGVMKGDVTIVASSGTIFQVLSK